MKFKASSFQADFLRRKDDPLVILQTGIGAGKTKALAMWCADRLMLGKRGIVCAQTFGALHRVIFQEIQNVLIAMDVRFEYKKSEKEIFVPDTGGIIYGATNENPNAVLGLTNIHFAGFDEGAYCSLDLYNYVCDRLRGADIERGQIRIISSPNSSAPEPWFANLCKANPDCVIRATTFDNPFISEQTKEDYRKRYGDESSPLYRQQLLGMIEEQDFKTAILKASDFSTYEPTDDGDIYFGIDFAGTGNDATCIVIRNKVKIKDRVYITSGNGIDECNQINELYNIWKPKGIAWDATGGFSKNMDLIKSRFRNVREVNFGEAATDPIFANVRAEMYFRLRDKVKEGFFIDRNKYPELYEQLHVTQFMITNKGKTALIPKDDIRRYLPNNGSPDFADALALSFMAEEIADNNETAINVAKTLSFLMGD